MAGRVRVAGAGGAGPGRGAVPGAGGVPPGAVRGGGGGGAGAAPIRAHPVRRRAEGVHRAQVRAAAGEARRGGALPPVRVPALAGHGVAHPVRLRPRPRLPPRRQAQGHQEGVRLACLGPRVEHSIRDGAMVCLLVCELYFIIV
jgi:hypothetical protein